MKITDKYVFFWKEHPMCNFTKCRIRFADPYYVPLENDPIEFTSSEQMFMWFKAVFFRDEEMAGKILQSQTPQEARDLGQQVRNYVDEEWDKARVDRMRTAVRYKFYQNENLRKQLMDTRYDGKTFVEASYYDRIWGIGYNQDEAMNHLDNWGHNELGKILTDLRNELKSKRSA